MLEKLKRFLFGDPREIEREFDHDYLGRLTFSDEDECWITVGMRAKIGFEFLVTADWNSKQARIGPAPVLIEAAVRLALDAETFKQKVERFLKSELERDAKLALWRNEVLALKIDTVCLFWPDRPGEGEIEFSAGDTETPHIWKCALADGAPMPMLGRDG